MKNALKFTKWVLVWTSTWTMLMTPVAMGQEAQKLSRAQLQGYVDQIGLNKSMTLGQFYQKNKHLFPKRLLKDIEPFFMNYKNAQMPAFEVVSTKNTLGEEVPTIRAMPADGTLINVQWFGEPDRLVRFQNTNLTAVDVNNVEDMFYRILHNEESFRKQVPYTSKPRSALKPKPSFNFAKQAPYPPMTKAMWKGLSAYEKANYVVTMRQLWQDAREVLKQKALLDQKRKKSSSYEFMQKHQNFFSFLHKLNIGDAWAQETRCAPTEGIDASSTDAGRFADCPQPGEPDGGPQSIAPPAPPPPNRTPPPAPPARTPPPAATDTARPNNAERINVAGNGVRRYEAGESCIIAGYVSRRTSDGRCRLDSIEQYQNSSNRIYNDANAACERTNEDAIACNPYVYGTPNGQPRCVVPDPSSGSEFQTATHAGGVCEQGGTNLTTGTFDDIFTTTVRPARYNSIDDTARLRILSAANGENHELTKNYLEGMLKFRGTLQANQTLDSVTDEAMLREVVLIRDTFNNEIQTARLSCQTEANAEDEFPHERNYWGACDQLFRRELFVKELFTGKCTTSGGTLNESDLMCECRAPAGRRVVPGVACGATPPTNAEVLAGGRCDMFGIANLTADCKCPGTNRDPRALDEGGFSCAAVGPTENAECNLMCRMRRGFNTILPFAIVALAIGAIFFLIPRNRVAGPQRPPDNCPNGVCPQVCTPPLASINGACACVACTPGTSRNPAEMTTANPCPVCRTSSSTTTNTYTCPDLSVVTGNSPEEALAKCPSTTCTNGQVVQNPLNCPEASTSSTGGGTINRTPSRPGTR